MLGCCIVDEKVYLAFGQRVMGQDPIPGWATLGSGAELAWADELPREVR